jgi:hypothetical protein
VLPRVIGAPLADCDGDLVLGWGGCDFEDFAGELFTVDADVDYFACRVAVVLDPGVDEVEGGGHDVIRLEEGDGEEGEEEDEDGDDDDAFNGHGVLLRRA